MLALTKRIARLWISKRAVYILKMNDSLLSCNGAMACMYQDLPALDWLDDAHMVHGVMEKIVNIYDLSHYDVQLILSGEYVQWKTIEVSSTQRKEAYDEVAWDDALAQQAETILYDIVKPTKSFDDSGYVWVVGAYSKRIASELYVAARSCCHGRIELAFLPQFIGEILEEQNGIITVWEKGRTHRFYLKKGQVHQYDCHDEPPFHEEGKNLGFSLHYQATTEDVLQDVQIRQNIKTFCHTYNISGPAALLIACPQKLMNIAPKQEKWNWKDRTAKALPFVVLVEWILLGITGGACWYTTGIWKEKQAYYQECIELQQQRIRTYNQIGQRKEAQAKTIQETMNNHRNWPGMLITLTEAKPADVAVLSSQSSPQGISLTLKAKEARSFQEWQGKLKKSPFFSTVTLGKIRKDPVTGHEGIIQLEMNHDTNRQE